jgi:hypothetical protein
MSAATVSTDFPALDAAPGLVDEDAGGGEGEPLPVGPAGEDEGSHRGGLSEADGLHLGPHVLDGVVYREAGGHGTARGVDVDRDILLGILGLEEEELANDEVGARVVDLAVHEDDPVLEEAGKDVENVFPVARGLVDLGHPNHLLVHDTALSHVPEFRAGLPICRNRPR